MKIEAPFTDEQVNKLEEFQNNPHIHPYTCCSPEEIPECLRACREINGKIVDGTSEGILKPTKQGMVCPCGKYVQKWAEIYNNPATLFH